MTRYFFHATDGYSVVIDGVGQRLWSRDLEDVAAEVAGDVRARFGCLADLSEWSIVVHDDLGEAVATLPFVDLPEVSQRDLAAA